MTIGLVNSSAPNIGSKRIPFSGGAVRSTVISLAGHGHPPLAGTVGDEVA